MSFPDYLEQACETAFWDTSIESNKDYRPLFISNTANNTMRVFLDRELSKCDRFIISVAFINESGLASLIQTLDELESRGVHGQILTTDYLQFTEPKALDRLMRYKNIELKMYLCSSLEGFHTKGYLFYHGELISIAIGSSNLTDSALSRNREWNAKFSATEKGEIFKSIIDDFNALWNKARKVDEELFNAYRERYEEKLEFNKKVKEIVRESKELPIELATLEPNSMQLDFLTSLQNIYDSEERKALLISATGTGKTYAAAFAIRKLNPKRMLFLVHREQIARKSLMSFKNVLANTKSYGMYTGAEKVSDADCVFATIQTIQSHLEKFKKDNFQIIIVDEAHHAGAESYRKIMNYFEPRFWLGMTATPERTDGFDVFKEFNHNIAHEIRLQEALELNLLCPFHYYGITDKFVSLDQNGKQITSDKCDFSKLISDERVDFILKKAKHFGYSGKKVKGLVFCSSIDEARDLAQKFTDRKVSSLALSGSNTQEEREKAIDRLVNDDAIDKLSYIFTRDIFNEGVDIPEINQVIMLRPTESPIVFVQQLGRGLRKYKSKEYVMVLDFIGNYDNNYMIPIALSGDRTYNKDNLRKDLQQGFLTGASSIHFDEIAREKIYKSIDSANFNDVKLIKECYRRLKFKLGKIPSLMDFEKYGELDVSRIFENQSLGSYHKFLVKYEKDYKFRCSADEDLFIEFISKKFANGKRPHELALLSFLIQNQPQKNAVIDGFEMLKNDYAIEIGPTTRENIVNWLTNGFAAGAAKETYSKCIFLEPANGDYKISDSFALYLKDEMFKNVVCELLKFGLYRNKKNYSDRYKASSLQLYSKYTYEDVCRLLEWKKSEVALNIGGYKYDRESKTLPIFINYEKDDSINATIKYEDRLISPRVMNWISKSKRNLHSEDVQTILHAAENNIKLCLFVRKNKEDKESKEFYYLGDVNSDNNPQEFVMPNTTATAVRFRLCLETPVKQALYDYLES